MVLKAVIVFCSRTGNTARIAEAIAAGLGEKGFEVVLKSVSEGVADGDVASADLVGFGSGIYGLSVDKRLLKFVDSLPPALGRKAFVFSTSGRGRGQTGSLRKALEKKGYSIVGEFACKGFDAWGPFKLVGGLNKGRPNAADLEDARKFGASLPA